MSDPACGGYQCHGEMEPVGYLGEAKIVGYICLSCGVTKNVVREGATMRARVDVGLYELATLRAGPLKTKGPLVV